MVDLSSEQLYLAFISDPELFQSEVARDSKLNRDDVFKNMINQPELYSKWARLSAEAEKQHEKYDAFINLLIWPAAKEAAREDLERRTQRATIDATDEAAKQHPIYLSAVQSRAALKAAWEVFKKMENTMFQRKDMLTGLNFRQQKEFASLPNTQ